ncbi:MAG: polymerase [Candidatus Parcubacteria bacterium]|nr:polymerase [Candidatus Parcubacteria bacterium]
MTMRPPSDNPFPRAIVHFDGDSFFASVEQTMNQALRGKVVITGGERGAPTSVSLEGKKLGLGRGMSMQQIRERCPEAVIVPSDYTAYSIYAHRMYRIARRFTPKVEEYSIDECFADITGLEEHYHASYAEIAMMIKRALETELGLTFGVGLAPNKVTAKAASKHRKPAGFTVISVQELPAFLRDLPIGKIWGIGTASSIELSKLGIRTALDLALKDDAWLAAHSVAKPYREICYELQGHFIRELNLEPDCEIGSIIKSRTFSPPSSRREFIFSQLSKNIENACIKARRHGVHAREVSFYLKTQQFTYHGLAVPLSFPTASPSDLIRLASDMFDKMYRPNVLYRATGVSLRALIPVDESPLDLFGQSAVNERSSQVLEAVDALDHRYGANTVFLASSMKAFAFKERKRRDHTVRGRLSLPSDISKKTIDIPFLGLAH